MSRRIHLRAPAKVNLTLEVLGRRGDGFHELRSVFATVDLADDVRVRAARTLDVRTIPDVGAAPADDLAVRAVRALAAATGREPFAHVWIRKRIPVAAGLGGGSTDAGAVLRALGRLWPLDGLDLGRVAAGIGSDVPFFASAIPYAAVGGRGEVVEALPSPDVAMWVALVRIPVSLSTASVFGALDRPASTGERSAAVAGLFRQGSADPRSIRAHLCNDLLPAAERLCQPIAEARALAAQRGIALTLSGSGPSLFALADDRAHALRMVRALKRAGLRARAAKLGAEQTLT